MYNASGILSRTDRTYSCDFLFTCIALLNYLLAVAIKPRVKEKFLTLLSVYFQLYVKCYLNKCCITFQDMWYTYIYNPYVSGHNISLASQFPTLAILAFFLAFFKKLEIKTLWCLPVGQRSLDFLWRSVIFPKSCSDWKPHHAVTWWCQCFTF